MKGKAVVSIKNGGDEVRGLFDNLEFESIGHEVSPLLLGVASSQFRSVEVI
jgi:hypothetical protein